MQLHAAGCSAGNTQDAVPRVLGSWLAASALYCVHSRFLGLFSLCASPPVRLPLNVESGIPESKNGSFKAP